MINKLSKIKNIGSFQFFEWDRVNPQQIIDLGGNLKSTQTEYRRFNVSYGENSTGKSTIVRIFKALHNNTDKDLKKNWDREGEDREIKIETNSAEITFSEQSLWKKNSLSGKFVFFDKKFIEEYVHSFSSGRNVEQDRNTGKLILYLGDFLHFKLQLDNLDKLCVDLLNKNEKFGQTNTTQIVNLGTEFDFDSIQKELTSIQSDVDQSDLKQTRKQIKDYQTKISKLEKILSNVREIENLEPLLEQGNQYQLQSTEVKEAKRFSVSSGTIEVLEKIKNKENFIYTGLEIVKNIGSNKCPFCEQEIKDGNNYLYIIQEYDKVFDSEFIIRQSEAEKTLEGYKSLLLELSRLHQPEDNPTRLAKMNKLLELFKSLPSLALKRKNLKLIEKEIKNTDAKLKKLLKKIDDGEVDKIVQLISNINKAINNYDVTVKKINSLFIKTQKELKTGELSREKEDLINKIHKARLREFVLKHRKFLFQINKGKELYEINKRRIEKLKQVQRLFIDKIKIKFKQFSDNYFANIELYIKKFCPSLEINILPTRSTYDLRASDVLCGFEVQYKNKPRLDELSEGEKQSIALAFFLALLNKTPKKDEKIVVFDDPITSFDAGKRKMCAEYILKEIIPFKQSFIFTCDSLFRTYCLKTIGRKFGNDRGYYYILKSSSSSVHHRNDHQTTIYSMFKSEFRAINSIMGTDENIIVYGQKLRYSIEEVKDKYLGYNNNSFDSILVKVKNCNILKLCSVVDDLLEIYSYCNTGGLAHYPRDGQTSWDELKMYIARYLRLDI